MANSVPGANQFEKVFDQDLIGLSRLRQIEIELTAMLHEVVDSETFESIQSEMEIELESFRERMPPEAFDKAKRVGIDRLLYDHFKLPKISFE